MKRKAKQLAGKSRRKPDRGTLLLAFAAVLFVLILLLRMLLFVMPHARHAF